MVIPPPGSRFISTDAPATGRVLAVPSGPAARSRAAASRSVASFDESFAPESAISPVKSSFAVFCGPSSFASGSSRAMFQSIPSPESFLLALSVFITSVYVTWENGLPTTRSQNSGSPSSLNPLMAAIVERQNTFSYTSTLAFSSVPSSGARSMPISTKSFSMRAGSNVPNPRT